MPRPGPRPYECVRRAWHSDRHQPIRGSLIQEIFRVVNEIHSSGTRKNKEWQKKLPIVVLKAEEIMYSKANSEAEYMDLKSLWDRANDAINTIIRRDGSTETGEFLQPCIEAALNLGCTPRRASRSQRNCNPGCYLRADTPEPPCVPPNDLQNPIQGNHIMNSNFITPATGNLFLLGPNFCGPIPPKHTHNTKMFPILAGNFPPCGNNPSLLTETYALSNSFSVYPLYYESLLQSQESQFSFGIPPDLNFDNPKPATTGHMRALSPCNVDGSDKLPHADLRDGPENPPGVDCDLSLRLGPLSVPCISIENSCPQEVEEVGSSASRERRKSSSDLTPWIDKEFSFFSNANADDSLGSYSSKWSSEAENMNVTRALRKRKAIFGNPYEDRQFCFQPKFPSKPPDWKCG